MYRCRAACERLAPVAARSCCAASSSFCSRLASRNVGRSVSILARRQGGGFLKPCATRGMSTGGVPGGNLKNMLLYSALGISTFGALYYAYNSLQEDTSRYQETLKYLNKKQNEQDWKLKPWPPSESEEVAEGEPANEAPDSEPPVLEAEAPATEASVVEPEAPSAQEEVAVAQEEAPAGEASVVPEEKLEGGQAPEEAAAESAKEAETPGVEEGRGEDGDTILPAATSATEAPKQEEA